MLLNKTIILLGFLLLEMSSFSQEINVDSPYLVNHKGSSGKLLTYGDTLTCGIKILLSKKDELKSIEVYNGGFKNGLSFYYKKGGLEHLSYYYNGLSDTLPNADFPTHKIELSPPANYGDWKFVAMNIGNDKTCLIMDSGERIGKKTVLAFRKTQLIYGVDYSNMKVSTIYFFNNANIKDYEVIDFR
nr:hypothetical protein [uncultured Flavobacterium sp.]